MNGHQADFQLEAPQLSEGERSPLSTFSEYTGFPEILDGRVKTLHPKVHGGLLGNAR